jgi:RNA methyltransferase, TrmH family
MLSKTQVKYIQSLFHKKFREEHGQFIVEGPKMAKEAIGLSPDHIEHIYACPDWFSNFDGDLGLLHEKGTRITEVEMEKISSLQTPSDVLVVLRKPTPRLPLEWKGINLVLDGIQDPGNLGTIIRTADWFGVQHIICGSGTADCYNPKAVQASMGSIFRMNLLYEDLDIFFEQDISVPILASSLAGRPLSAEDHWKDALLVIGNESQGVRQKIISHATHKILIPCAGHAESLNAAVATGILLYELTN